MTYRVTYKNGQDRLFGQSPTTTVLIEADCMEEVYDIMYDEGIEDSDIIKITQMEV